LAPSTTLLHGTLEALILKTLAHGPRHGYAVARYIEEESGEAVLVEEGSLYPALYRMEEHGLIESEWGATENNRQAKFYKLTRKGRRAAQEELESWQRLSGGVSRVLRGIEQEG
jgi:PadR family transcriptional regulator PadR